MSTTLPEYVPIRRLDVTETATLVRAALKRAFPGQKFRVRSSRYSGGSSIDVGWTDGPTGHQVRRVIEPYSGADFDGMVDLKVHCQHWLEPDGTARLAQRPGTNGSFVEVIEDPPSPNAELVRFGADFVHGQRRESDEWRAAVLAMLAEKAGVECPDPNDWRGMSARLVPLHVARLDGSLLHMVETERTPIDEVARAFMGWRQGGSLDQGPQPEQNGRW